MNHTTKHTHSNHLEGESSPYLLMHARNPVDWYPWGQAAFDKATKENKPLIISIGYAACHWCHVMENQSFEDPEVARIMNQYFVSVKVDREERPDIDQVYMNAVQLLTGSGGWPLNAVALPDGRPFYAGTYFPKEAWVSVLQQISNLYQNDPQKLVEQAERITQGIRSMDFIDFAAPRAGDDEPGFSPTDMEHVFSHFERLVDFQLGGHKGAPKFPMPIDFRFLLHYFFRSGNQKAIEAVKVTLDRMARGGIYDQVGGGFARYSTDSYWKVPHFEKMLYDNAQLVSLYSRAYQLTRDPLYKQVVFRTLEFIDRELTAPAYSAFYSSLDADSEGEEGKFYVWSLEEIETILGKEAPLVMDYYNVTPGGNWEDRKNILFRTKSDEVFARDRGIGLEELRETVTRARAKLLEARSKRVPPQLDDKILTAWNALMLTAYVDAYRAFDEESFLEKALANARFIVTYMLAEDRRLNRVYKAGKPSSAINGFLDDYAFTMQAFISLYQATFDQQWLFRARELFEYVLAHFYDQGKGMFFYTSDIDPGLIARKMEITDNVIPGSNSVIAVNLFLLGEYFSNPGYINLSRQMLANVKVGLLRHGTHFANWAILMGYFIQPPYEVAIVGQECLEKRKELDRHFLPHMILSGGKTPGKLPLLEGKLVKDRTFIYVCKNKVCRKPVTRTEEALEQLKK